MKNNERIATPNEQDFIFNIDSIGGAMGHIENPIVLCSPSMFKMVCEAKKINRKKFFRIGKVKVVKMKSFNDNTH